MLNIGRLAPRAAEYYLGEVATAAEDYYSGRGESPGRWVGSLSAALGLVGAVDPEAFRAVLEGRHPVTGEHLVAGGSGACRARPLSNRHQLSLFGSDVLDVGQVAARLHVSTRHVRRLLAAGARATSDGTAVRPGTTLVGERVRTSRRRGPLAWLVPRSEVERFEGERRRTKRRPGYDLTLRPPKSVSVLWAVTDESRRRVIRDAHRSAVDVVVAYYERHACFARRPTAERGRIETDGLVAAAFDHRTSRAGDPLLHTHVVCANLTRTAEGRWQAIDGRPIYEHAHAAGYLYQAHLRHALTSTLGVRWGAVHHGYAEIEGVPRAVLRAFSKRRDEIEQLVAESGYVSARAHQTATLATRRAKDYGVDAVGLDATWRDEAFRLGFGPDDVEACFGRAASHEPPDTAALFERLGGPNGLTCQASTFTRHDVVEAIAEASGETLNADRIDDLASSFLGSGHVHALAAGPGQPGCGLWRRDGTRQRTVELAHYTTPELLDLEQRVLAWAAAGFGTPVPVAAPDALAGALARRPELSSEQAAVVRAVCGPSPALQAVAGRPGSGKTHATAACVDAFLASGVPAIGCALSAVAAAELESAAGLLERTGRPATTIARLLVDLEASGLPPGTVLFVDEASMVGTRDLVRLGALAARAGGALKLVGDPDQHGPVATGGVFRRLVEAGGGGVPRLVENNRQEAPEERRAVEEFRQELVELALTRYDDAGKVVRSRTADESYDAMVTDWCDHVRAGGTDPMIAGTNHVRRALNVRARRRLVAERVVTGPAVAAGDREFQRGDWVVTRRNARQLRSADGRHMVKNGSAGRVVAVDSRRGSLHVAFAVEGRIELPSSYVQAGHVEHGYARTSYGVQGATLDLALYHPGDASSFEEGYVALTRGRRATRIYVVDGATSSDDSHRGHEASEIGLETIAQALERRRSKTLATDADPLAADSRLAFDGWTLADLGTERRRLEAILAAAPREVDEAITATRRQRDALLARRRAIGQVAVRGGVRRRLARRRLIDESNNVVTWIDRAIDRADQRLTRLEEQQRVRAVFLDEHATEVERLRVLLRAELARELCIRASAVASPDEAVARVAGPAPAEPARHQWWRNAVERAAVHADRYSDPLREPAHDDPGRWSYERVADAFRALADEGEARFEVPEPGVLVDG